MLNKYYRSLLILAFCTGATLAYGTIKIEPQANKYYIDPSQILINENGIFFFADGTQNPINELNHDENGFNISLAPMYWICKNGHINPLYLYPCSKCGAGAPGTK